MSAPGRFIACVSKSKQVSNRNAGDAKSLGSGVDVESLSLPLHEAPAGGLPASHALTPNSHKAAMIGGQALGHHYRQSFGKESELRGRLGDDLTIGIDRPRSRGAERHVAGALPVQDVGLWQAELEMSHASEELPNGTGQNDVKIERAVIDCSMLCHGQAAAVITTVCDANLVDCA